MHPALHFLSFYSWGIVLATEEKAIQFMQEVGLIPSINSPCPACPICGAPTKTEKLKSRKIGFRYICTKRRNKKCYGTVNPLKNTVMVNSKLPFRDVMGIMFAFVKNLQITETINTMMNWRAFREEPTISSESVTDYYSNFTEIAEIIASHHSKQLGGPGKTIVLDDTFLTTKKSNRGRTATSVVRVVFGIFCKDNHEGIFFRTDQKKKKDLWPLIKEYVHPETTICHGESSSRSTEKMIRKKMALKYYRRSRLGKQNHGGQVWQFIQDVIQVYPGCLKPGIDLLQIDKVLPDKIEICDMMPTEIEKSEDSDVAQLSDLEQTDMKDQDIEIHDQNLEMQLGCCKPGIDPLQVLPNKIQLCDLMPIKIERTEDADVAQLDLEETVMKDDDIEMHTVCCETGIDLLQMLPEKYEICNPLLIKIERSVDSDVPQLSDLEATDMKDGDIEMHTGCCEPDIDLLQVLPDKVEICDMLPIKIERSEDTDVVQLDLEGTDMKDDDIEMHTVCCKPGIDLLQVLPDKDDICDLVPIKIERSEDSDVAQLTNLKDGDIEMHTGCCEPDIDLLQVLPDKVEIWDMLPIKIERIEVVNVTQLSDLEETDMKDQDIEMHTGCCEPDIDLLQVLPDKVEICDKMSIKIGRTEDADVAQLDLEETVMKDDDIEMHPGCCETGIDLLQMLPDKVEICNLMPIEIKRREDFGLAQCLDLEETVMKDDDIEMYPERCKSGIHLLQVLPDKVDICDLVPIEIQRSEDSGVAQLSDLKDGDIEMHTRCCEPDIDLLQVLPDKVEIRDMMPIKIERSEAADVAQSSHLEETDMKDYDNDDEDMQYIAGPNQKESFGERTSKRRRTEL
ncbi:uncharacterized protein CDAR_606811 [Caerostris darwini]|uniref:Transposase n=1 Tax=Caerostris darwini TaxID=1538125 RepID=A0AAV4QYJ8_9ARAC|nr:uncharacterized protein CDAR_606811 [Caerostris darwini]